MYFVKTFLEMLQESIWKNVGVTGLLTCQGRIGLEKPSVPSNIVFVMCADCIVSGEVHASMPYLNIGRFKVFIFVTDNGDPGANFIWPFLLACISNQRE